MRRRTTTEPDTTDHQRRTRRRPTTHPLRRRRIPIEARFGGPGPGVGPGVGPGPGSGVPSIPAGPQSCCPPPGSTTSAIDAPQSAAARSTVTTLIPGLSSSYAVRSALTQVVERDRAAVRGPRVAVGSVVQAGREARVGRLRGRRAARRGQGHALGDRVELPDRRPVAVRQDRPRRRQRGVVDEAAPVVPGRRGRRAGPASCQEPAAHPRLRLAGDRSHEDVEGRDGEQRARVRPGRVPVQLLVATVDQAAVGDLRDEHLGRAGDLVGLAGVGILEGDRPVGGG